MQDYEIRVLYEVKCRVRNYIPDAPAGQRDFNNIFVEGENVSDRDGLLSKKHKMLKYPYMSFLGILSLRFAL